MSNTTPEREALAAFALELIATFKECAVGFDAKAHPFNDKLGDHPETLVEARTSAAAFRDAAWKVREAGEKKLRALAASPAAGGVQPDSVQVPRSLLSRLVKEAGSRTLQDADAINEARALYAATPPAAPAAVDMPNYKLVRSIIHKCPAIKLPQSFVETLGMTAQIVPVHCDEETAAALVARLNAAAPAAELDMLRISLWFDDMQDDDPPEVIEVKGDERNLKRLDGYLRHLLDRAKPAPAAASDGREALPSAHDAVAFSDAFAGVFDALAGNVGPLVRDAAVLAAAHAYTGFLAARAPQAAAEVTANGLTEAETDASPSVAGLSQPTAQAEAAAQPKLIGWRTDDYLMETPIYAKAKEWEVHYRVMPIFEGDLNTKLGARPSGESK